LSAFSDLARDPAMALRLQLPTPAGWRASQRWDRSAANLVQIIDRRDAEYYQMSSQAHDVLFP